MENINILNARDTHVGQKRLCFEGFAVFPAGDRDQVLPSPAWRSVADAVACTLFQKRNV